VNTDTLAVFPGGYFRVLRVQQLLTFPPNFAPVNPGSGIE